MTYLGKVDKGEKRNKAFHNSDFPCDDLAEERNEYLCVIADALTAIADSLEAQEQRELDRIIEEEEAKVKEEEQKAEMERLWKRYWEEGKQRIIAREEEAFVFKKMRNPFEIKK